MARLTLLCLRFMARMTDEAALAALDRWRALISEVDAYRATRGFASTRYGPTF
jgi:hypothetical protein